MKNEFLPPFLPGCLRVRIISLVVNILGNGNLTPFDFEFDRSENT